MKVCETHSEVRLFSKCSYKNSFWTTFIKLLITVRLYNQLNVGFGLFMRCTHEGNISDQTDP